MKKVWTGLKWIWNLLILFLTVYVLTVYINLTFAIGYIAMLAIHELGHMMTAKAYGATVCFGGFTPFGAYIQITNDTSIKEDAVIALSGPLCGLVSTLLYYFLFYLLKEQTFLWLSFFTGMVSLLNLLPMNPLDGGKLIAGTFPCFSLILALFGAMGIYYAYQQNTAFFPVLAAVLIFLILYIITDVIRMKHSSRIEKLLRLDQSSKGLIFFVYLVILLLLAGLLAAMAFDYREALYPQIRAVNFPEDLIPSWLLQWLTIRI